MCPFASKYIEFEELKDFQKTAVVKVHLVADLNRKVDQKDTRMRDHYEFLILLCTVLYSSWLYITIIQYDS